MKRSFRMIFAGVLIFFLWILWIGIGAAVFGWRYGGGAIPTLLFFSLAGFVWKTITKKEEKSKNVSEQSDQNRD